MKNRLELRPGQIELRSAGRKAGGHYAIVFLFSVFVNLLMLAGPLYMLQVYDRVLTGRSVETLIALSSLLAMAFLCMGFLDHARSRLLARIGANFQTSLDQRVFNASVQRLARVSDDPLGQSAQHDVDAVQRWLASPVLLAFFDLPWTPLFVAAIFIFHPALGWLAVAGGSILIALTLLNHVFSADLTDKTQAISQHAHRMADTLKTDAEAVLALGMAGSGLSHWYRSRNDALLARLRMSDRTGLFTVIARVFRQFLQSAMLGFGAWLALKGALSPGAMIAASILLGRALAPVEMIVAQWTLIQDARESRKRLARLLSLHPEPKHRTELPRPSASLDVRHLSIVPPAQNRAVLHNLTFALQPGQAIGVIGPSGSGKSSLARALVHVWQPATGTIRLNGASLDQFNPDTLGSYIGYLPQRVTLFEGTIGQNISRLANTQDSAAIVQAAQKAAAHDMILHLPNGYDTPIASLGGRLSGGQIQRIGLARAFYGNPVLLVLDEPNSNLDNDGALALNHAIRTQKANGGGVMIMAHRPAAIQECDLLLVLENGTQRAFGPRDEVLRATVRTRTGLVRAPVMGPTIGDVA